MVCKERSFVTFLRTVSVEVGNGAESSRLL